MRKMFVRAHQTFIIAVVMGLLLSLVTLNASRAFSYVSKTKICKSQTYPNDDNSSSADDDDDLNSDEKTCPKALIATTDQVLGRHSLTRYFHDQADRLPPSPYLSQVIKPPRC